MSERNRIMKNHPQAPKRRSYHHGDLRAQLVEATRALVEEKGPDHFSVSEACRVAGVSTAAPYKHFKDKDEMLEAVASAGMARQYVQMQTALADLPKGSIDRISAIGRVYVDFASEEPGVFRLMFGLAKDHADNANLVSQGEGTFGLVCQEVADFLRHDEVGPEAVRRAFLLWSFVHGLSFLMIDGKIEMMGLDIDKDSYLAEIGARVLRD